MLLHCLSRYLSQYEIVLCDCHEDQLGAAGPASGPHVREQYSRENHTLCPTCRIHHGSEVARGADADAQKCIALTPVGYLFVVDRLRYRYAFCRLQRF
jgi:hypothetical protein